MGVAATPDRVWRAGCLLGVCAVSAWGVPWHQAVLATVVGVVSLGFPTGAARWLLAAGAAALLGRLSLPAVSVVAACAALGRPRGPLAVTGGLALAVAAALAAKQALVAAQLPAAGNRVEEPLVLGVAVAASAWLAAGPAGGARAGGWLVIPLLALPLHVAWAARQSFHTRLAHAQRLDLVQLQHARLLNAAEGQLGVEALVAAAPQRDEAASDLAVERALDAGWRPQLAAGRVVEVARALEARGRGGEALRLLARHPREGEVDALRTLFERLQGKRASWAGGQLGHVFPAHPSTLALNRELVANGEIAWEFTLAGACELRLELGGESFDGPPVAILRLDGAEPLTLVVDGELSHSLGEVEAGPHRLRVAFHNDAQGLTGDRNLHVRALSSCSAAAP